jgi:hypothetical protein
MVKKPPFPYPCGIDQVPEFKTRHEAEEFIAAYQEAGRIKRCAHLYTRELGGGYYSTRPRTFGPGCQQHSFRCEDPLYATPGAWRWYGCPTNCLLYRPGPGAPAGASATLEDLIRARNVPEIEKEFQRALENIEADPPSAVTAACAIVEATCKTIIAEDGLTMPTDQSIQPLWRTVQAHLQLHPTKAVDTELRQTLSGLVSIVHGVGGLRTLRGSAHGQGPGGGTIEFRHARLAVHAAHTLVVFMLESWSRTNGAGPP